MQLVRRLGGSGNDYDRTCHYDTVSSHSTGALSAGLSSQFGGSLEEREERGGMSLHVSVAVDTVHCERRERSQWRQHHAETDNEQTDRLNRQAIQGQWSSAHLLVQMK